MESPPPFIDLLLVDDEQGYVDVLANRLARRSIRTFKALGGTQAIQALRKRDVHVVVLDLKMKDMDGMDVLKTMRRMVPDLPVILLTGHGAADTADRARTLGAFDCLIKPCEFMQLVETIQAAALHSPVPLPKEIS